MPKKDKKDKDSPSKIEWVKQDLSKGELVTWLKLTAAPDCPYSPENIQSLQNRSDVTFSLRDDKGKCHGYAFLRNNKERGWTLMELGFNEKETKVAVRLLDEVIKDYCPLAYKPGTCKDLFAEFSQQEIWRYLDD